MTRTPGVAGVVVAAATLLVSATPVMGGSVALPRAITDRPDDSQAPQIHVMYVLPSDAADRALDTDGTIQASVRNFQTWLKGQTGGLGLHLDTFQGQLDVTFVRLGQTDAQLSSHGGDVLGEIERELQAAGFAQAGKIYALYYEGTNTAACANGFWPPAVPGTVGAVYLRATYGAGLLCYEPRQSRAGIQYMDFGMLHEILHVMGFVATCSPHHTRAGHVSDSPKDIMWAGDADWTPSVLDVGRDDYFNADVPGCLDLADSPYLMRLTYRLTVVVKGPGRVTSTPAGVACPRSCRKDVQTGSPVRLQARPAKGAHLVSWKGSCQGRDRCSVTMDADRTVTAVFRR